MRSSLCSLLSRRFPVRAAQFPIDFSKTRLQLQNELGKTLSGEVATTKLGMVQTFRQILAHEGLLAMYSGLGASALRQAVYGGIGVGLYAPVRQLIIGDQDPKDAALWKRMLAGAITGAVWAEAALMQFIIPVVRTHLRRPLMCTRLSSRGCRPSHRVSNGRRKS
jgi:hypothetical protein